MSTLASNNGAIKEPTPKKKCKPFMNGPALLPCVHNSRVLHPTSTIPPASPLRNMANKSIHSTGAIGINTDASAMASKAMAINL